MPSLGTSYGRGAATLAQWDLAKSDCVVIMGSNMAENHPIAFRFVMQAKAKGAAVVHADPRFTRTSALADIYAPVRAGSDIAFLGGIIRYLLENDAWFRDYALAYTNLSTIIRDDFQGPEDLDGVFSGFEPDMKAYFVDSWQYEGMAVPSPRSEHHPQTEMDFTACAGRMSEKPPHRDPTLRHPQCVYQIMRRHYARYTPEMVERVTGCRKETFLKICETLARNSGRERTSAFCYAVGWTHHSTGVQIIRAAAIIQALLGNVGRPGGGILALRGHSSIQGSTDIPTLYNMLPGYLAQPNVNKSHGSLDDYLKGETPPTGWWHNEPKYVISLLKAWYGDRATAANDYGFDWVPKIIGDHSQLPMTLAIRDNVIKGMFLLGQNPAIGGSNSRLVQRGLAELDWLVVRDFAETETAAFWYQGCPVRDGELAPSDIKTEVFLMPASIAGEKDGTFTNTHRLVQWHDKVVDGPGDSRSELWFIHHLAKRLKALYADSRDARDRPIQALNWPYPEVDARGEPDVEAVLKEINGYTCGDETPVGTFKDLKDDGSTACGCWIYSGVYPKEGHNQARSRKADGPGGPGTHLGWAFAWPANRRTLYNRASADLDGKPWSEEKTLVWWDADKESWQSPDAIDFEPSKAPGYQPDWNQKPEGMDALDGGSPFIMTADGKAALFVPSGLKDAPLPTHYEPIESPVLNPLYAQQSVPTAKRWNREDNPYHAPEDAQYPHILTTYRLTEHHSGGTPTRSVPSTAELQPEGFCEIPPELAARHGLRTGDWVVLETSRGAVETRALVTSRLRPFEIDGRAVFQIGMPWHFGWRGYATGDVANVLTSIVGDANTTMHENKALTCRLRPGRLSGGRR
ncbi:Formate dehydrogenase O alpha subunit [Caenispirillum salinarum AK4]|uniref:Formate dehydrogenase O alpha subunit n=1 Tax=Caenispirillum salinarum AK4 TaxID=1238182 RepID=K9GUM6_9PROT|nr:Formate dehydrogenase O alpha subunit [Caenispirillum salinarum AK4]